MVGRTLTANPDIFALFLRGTNRHRQQCFHRIVALIEQFRHHAGVTIQTERQLLNSQAVFFGAIVAAAPELADDWEDYYLMYDVVTARTANQNEQGPGVAQIQVRAHDPDVAREITDAIPES